MLNPFLTLDISRCIGEIRDVEEYRLRQEELEQGLKVLLSDRTLRAVPLENTLTTLCRRWLDEKEQVVSDHLCRQFINWRYQLALTLADIVEDRCTTLTAQRQRDPRLGAVSQLDFVTRKASELLDTTSLSPMKERVTQLLKWRDTIQKPLPDRSWFLRLAVNLQMTPKQADALLYIAGYIPLYDRQTGELLAADPESAALGTFLKWAEQLPLAETDYIVNVTRAGIGTTTLCCPNFRYLVNKDELNALIRKTSPNSDRYHAFYFSSPKCGISTSNSSYEQMLALLIAACGRMEQQPNGSFEMSFYWPQPFPDLKQLMLFTRRHTVGYSARLSRVQLLLNRYSGGTTEDVCFPMPGEADFERRVCRLRETLEALPPEPSNPRSLGFLQMDSQDELYPRLNGYLLCISLVRLFTTGHFLSETHLTEDDLYWAYDMLEQENQLSDIEKFSAFAASLTVALSHI